MVRAGRQGRQANLCSGYLNTEIELLASPDTTINGGTRVCVPANVEPEKLMVLIRDYAHRDPAHGIGIASSASAKR